MNLFASSNNNPVILPGKCVSCLMPLYAGFFYDAQEFIYRFILQRREMTGRKCLSKSFIYLFISLCFILSAVDWLGVG